jgi:predicted dehydrogenase
VIGFAIAGTGRMAAKMAAVIARSDEARVVRIASGSQERAAAFAAQHKIGAWGHLATALADPEVDAVYVAGRNRDHAAISLAALAAGRAVLCEKPFACNMAEAQSVIDAARLTAKPFMEAVATPFLPAVAEAIARVQLGEFGPVRQVEASFGYPVDEAREPHLFAADAGVLRDRAVYPLTLALLLQGAAIMRQIERDGDDTVRLALQHEQGGRSQISVSFSRRLANRLVIQGERGCITVPAPLLTAQQLAIGEHRFAQMRQHPILRRISDAAARIGGSWRPLGTSPYAPELQHFCAMIRDGRAESPVLTRDLMLNVQHIIAEAEAG